MEQIASFTIDHLRLEPGVYVSRVDRDPASGAVITTFDLRLTAPNREPVMDTAAVHAIEHLLATFLRNDEEWASRIVYFGPMGCRTGFYLIVFGECTPKEVLPLVTRAFELNQAHWWARRYLDNTLYAIDDAHMTYPGAE